MSSVFDESVCALGDAAASTAAISATGHTRIATLLPDSYVVRSVRLQPDFARLFIIFGTLSARAYRMSTRRSSSPSWLLATTAAGLLAIAPRALLSAEDQAVLWTNTVNATVSNGSLQKTAGCDGCDDAGAISQQVLVQGDGFVEFSVGESNTLWAA